nr:hypothetical protein [Microvirga zambiensis]
MAISAAQGYPKLALIDRSNINLGLMREPVTGSENRLPGMDVGVDLDGMCFGCGVSNGAGHGNENYASGGIGVTEFEMGRHFEQETVSKDQVRMKTTYVVRL